MMTHPDHVLVGDNEREATIKQLRDAFADGRLTVDEFSDRITTVFAARTHGEMALVTRDLPTSRPPAPRPGSSRLTVTLFGSTKRNDHWRVDDETRSITVCGECQLDLRRALVSSREIVVDAFVLFGSVKVIVPKGTRVELDGPTIFASKECKFDDDTIEPNAPIVRVRGTTLFGSVEVLAASPRKTW